MRSDASHLPSCCARLFSSTFVLGFEHLPELAVAPQHLDFEPPRVGVDIRRAAKAGAFCLSAQEALSSAGWQPAVARGGENARC